jgi:hypothetical protein
LTISHPQFFCDSCGYTVLLSYKRKEQKKMKFLTAAVLAAFVPLSTAGLFAPNRHHVAFLNSRTTGVSTEEDGDSVLHVALDTRGGASKKKKKKSSKKEEKKESEAEPEETVDAEELYLPGLLGTVITRTNKVCYQS